MGGGGERHTQNLTRLKPKKSKTGGEEGGKEDLEIFDKESEELEEALDWDAGLVKLGPG